ncbi:Pycsar system effector family protein [Streptomyces sp. NPDC093260]|uniref:Pycsar system effector family protein n=1 Tax=Streptomyces sp. NPDC093260 TaxID=3155073 RepID=UPI0034483F15
MSAPTTPAAATADTNLTDALAAVTTEIGRTDGKASLLLAFTGAALAGLASLAGHHLPTPAAILGALAVTALAAATVLLLLVVRPRLSGGDRASFPYWARLDEDGIRACMNGDTRTARIRVLSVIALVKFGRLRRAVDCILLALALLALAALTALAA